MNHFYEMREGPTSPSIHIGLDYDLDDVVDPFRVDNPGDVNDEWLCKFSYTVKGNLALDTLTNDVGWFIVSTKLSNLLVTNCKNRLDLNLIQFPEKITGSIKLLKDYRILGLNRTCACIDKQNTDAKWSKPDAKYAETIYTGYILQDKVPLSLDIFRLEESPAIMIVRENIYKAIVNAKVTGIDWRPFYTI